MRKIVLFIAMSCDGYICDKNESLNFLGLIEDKEEDYGYFDFIKTIDTVIVGKNTYQKVISMGYEYPHKDKDVYIISNSKIKNTNNYKIYTGDLKVLVSNIKKEKGKDIYCDGGANIITQLLSYNLIDKLIISIIPALLGGGIRLFNGDYPFSKLEHIKTETYKKGLVQIHYQRTI